MGNFDLDLDFGQIFEGKVSDIFTKGKIEVKTERDTWLQTGNIAIEYKYKGKPSGLSTTEADTWIHLLSVRGEIVGGFIIPVKVLRVRVKQMLYENSAWKRTGGDCDESQLILCKISRIFIGEHEKY